jgi:hypothetical protein
MKRLIVCAGLIAASATLFAQMGSMENMGSMKSMGAPKSPAATESGVLGGKTFTISYSSPRVNGRAGHIFTKDGLIGHDSTYPVWRAGANAATKLHTEADLSVGGLTVPAGDYTLFVDISDPGQWVLIINKQTGQWGTLYDKAQDLGRVPMNMEKPPATAEKLAYIFMVKKPGAKEGTLSLVWENLCGSVPVKLQ